MQKLFISAVLFFLFIVIAAHAGDKNAPPPPPPADKAAIRKKDSITYANLVNEAGLYSYQTDTNEIMLYNGIKLHFNKLTRMRMPRGLGFNIPDSSVSREGYDPAEIEITGTNTNTTEVKLDGSEPVLVSLKLYSADNYKAYPSQHNMSYGSYYLKVEPQQTETMNKVYAESHDFLDVTYKPGQIKTFRGIVVAIPKNVKHFDKIVVYTREFGQNRSYGCPAKF